MAETASHIYIYILRTDKSCINLALSMSRTRSAVKPQNGCMLLIYPIEYYTNKKKLKYRCSEFKNKKTIIIKGCKRGKEDLRFVLSFGYHDKISAAKLRLQSEAFISLSIIQHFHEDS